jgi:hypothetical protein
MDHRLTPEEENAIIEDALKNALLVPMPFDITANVMARIQKDERPALVTRNDLVISLVIALCIAALFFASRNLPPMLVMEIRKQTILAYQAFLVNSRWLVPSMMFGLAAFFAALTIPYLSRQLNKV